MLEGFHRRTLRTKASEIFVAEAGEGPPLLLLHGYPQTHVMWHKVAPLLAKRFRVVLADLRGYGASGKPPPGPDCAAYAKRAMAADMVEVMETLGFARFVAAGHDRGGRVLHRMCLDHPERLLRAAVLDIVPTRTVFKAIDRTLASGYEHWFFLSQPAPLPERLIGNEPEFYLTTKLRAWSGGRDDFFAPEALKAYAAAFADPATIAATCDDYRAAATIDLAHDAADEDRRIACPLLVLWGEKGLMHRTFDVLATWRAKADGPVEGRALPAGHFLVEEAPDAVLAELTRFFGA